MRKIKIALIGLNRHSHAQPIISCIRKNDNIFDFAGYALTHNEDERFPEIFRYLEGCKRLSVDEIMNDTSIEAVAIETEEIYLSEYATLAAKHGKHIHMEKPGGTSVSEFEALIDLVKKGGKTFNVGYMYRYNPIIRDLLSRINSGEFGKIISVDAQMSCYHPTETRQWLETFPGGMMFFLGCHLVDLILQIQGKPENVIPLNRSSGIDGVSAQDFGMAIFEYPNGVSVAKASAVEIGGFTTRRLLVSGTKKAIEIKPLEFVSGENLLVSEAVEFENKQSWSDRGSSYKSGDFNRYDDMMKAFASMVRGECENPYTYDYELELYKTVMKACGGEEK